MIQPGARLMFSIHAAFLSLALTQPVAAEGITPEQARQAVKRSLPSFTSEGEGWIRGRQCMSCHHVGFMIWGLNEAQRRGLMSEHKELAYSADWAVKYATYQGVFYEMNEPTLTGLAKAGLAQERLTELKKVKKTFASL